MTETLKNIWLYLTDDVDEHFIKNGRVEHGHHETKLLQIQN